VFEKPYSALTEEEWRSTSMSLSSVPKLNSLCLHSLSAFTRSLLLLLKLIGTNESLHSGAKTREWVHHQTLRVLDLL